MQSAAHLDSTVRASMLRRMCVNALRRVPAAAAAEAGDGALSSNDQRRIFARAPPGVRKVVVATNIAETSVTIDDVRYVIDTGLERRSSWNPKTCMQELVTQRITKSSMLQRMGRAGRVASGICVRLYSEEEN